MDNDRRIPCPNGCGRFCVRGAGMASHLRGNRCPGRVREEVPIQPVVVPEPGVPPPRQANNGRIPYLLYMVATPGNQTPHDDDNFSTISAQLDDLDNLNVPDDLLEHDFIPDREDGRLPRVIELVNDLIERRPPLPRPSFGRIALRSGQYIYAISNHLFLLLIIYVCIMAIIYCHTDRFAQDAADYYTDPEVIKNLMKHV